MMSEGSDIGKSFCKFLAQIAEREKVKAIQRDKYDDAFLAFIFECLLKGAGRSF